MKRMQKLKWLKGVLVLAGVLAMAGGAWAKKPAGAGPGVPGTLDATRTSVEVSVPVPAYAGCTGLNQAYAVKAYVFQPSGRIFAIGIGEPTMFNCSVSTEQLVPMTVNAFPGLSFKPGPATLLYQVILTEDDGDATTPLTESIIYEYGSRIDLH